MPEHLHNGHRDRLRERFLNEGMLNFPDHNILELLLFYSIPRKDTNELAHRLLNKFGSLAAVFDATFEQLIEVKGVSRNCAVLIKMIPQLSRAYLMDKETRYPYFGDIHKLGSYVTGQFISERNEKLLLILLNNRAEMISKDFISEGTVNRTKIDIAKINAMIHERHAASFVLVHNHPDGDATPSHEDIAVTKHISQIFRELGCPLAEHIVVAGLTYSCILSHIESGEKIVIHDIYKEK